ncbi:hypothetical protein PR003_g22965 [Phytophthora rubi]|uniref:Uncharacterized protein n=1 Tax=Phytophthora rubi TaxID=129364 RepID=A0A6A3J8L0_9STRA|nr:hypothetical protein PR002_g22004 [Phytophthora rubi]KAE8990940.1 hypothetical protein PR001_g21365 [Phytophthora rubi]KAE9299565.1 hypothetical protein PR003_g22965 [Phytophthora rubi]
MEGDIPTDFLQDLDLWLSQGGAVSPAINTHNLDASASNAGVPSLEAAVLTPTAPETSAATADSLIAALTDDSLPWTELTDAPSIAKAAQMLSASTPTPPTSQNEGKVKKPTRARKGRPPTKTSGSHPPQKKSKTNKSTSQRQKEELTYLKETAEQLEVELASLRQKNREELERQQREREHKELNGTTTVVTRTLDKSGTPAQPNVSLWERIARRQREEKATAEVENVKLREMVQSQMRLVKSFERLLRKRKIWDQLQENIDEFSDEASGTQQSSEKSAG